MGELEKEVIDLPEFTVVQLALEYPDDTIMDTIQRLNISMLEEGWTHGVGVVTSRVNNAIYIVYERSVPQNDNLPESQEARSRQA